MPQPEPQAPIEFPFSVALINHSFAVAPFPGAVAKTVTAQAPFVGVAMVPAAH